MWSSFQRLQAGGLSGGAIRADNGLFNLSCFQQRSFYSCKIHRTMKWILNMLQLILSISYSEYRRRH